MKWLDSALDMGISEYEFWEMTLAELTRAMQSKNRVKKMQAQEQATFDYILADLIGRSIGRIYSSSTTIPEISAVYPSLFDSKDIEEKKAEKKAELSALRFKQFANSFNAKYKGGAKADE
jgi:hypothetical protein